MKPVTEHIKQEGFDACKLCLTGNWITASFDKFEMFAFRLKHDTENPFDKEEVVLRLHQYNPSKNTVITIPETAETVIAYLLHEQGLAPTLLAIFKAGRIEELLPCTPLNPQSVFESFVLNQVALTIAKLHQMNQIPIAKNGRFLHEKIETFKELTERRSQRTLTAFNEEMTNQLRQQNLISFDLIQELEYVHQLLSDCSEPLVFSHNDISLSSMLWRKDQLKDQNTFQTKLMLINYDLCGYNFRAFDLANWLNSAYAIHLESHAAELISFDAEPFVYLRKSLIEEYLRAKNQLVKQSLNDDGNSDAQKQYPFEREFSILELHVIQFQMISTMLSLLLSLSTEFEPNQSFSPSLVFKIQLYLNQKQVIHHIG